MGESVGVEGSCRNEEFSPILNLDRSILWARFLPSIFRSYSIAYCIVSRLFNPLPSHPLSPVRPTSSSSAAPGSIWDRYCCCCCSCERNQVSGTRDQGDPLVAPARCILACASFVGRHVLRRVYVLLPTCLIVDKGRKLYACIPSSTGANTASIFKGERNTPCRLVYVIDGMVVMRTPGRSQRRNSGSNPHMEILMRYPHAINRSLFR